MAPGFFTHSCYQSWICSNKSPACKHAPIGQQLCTQQPTWKRCMVPSSIQRAVTPRQDPSLSMIRSIAKYSTAQSTRPTKWYWLVEWRIKEIEGKNKPCQAYLSVWMQQSEKTACNFFWEGLLPTQYTWLSGTSKEFVNQRALSALTGEFAKSFLPRVPAC